MYLLQAQITNVRGFSSQLIRFSHTECPGWHVILGNNGSGKSSLLRALALGFVGPSQANALRLNWLDWIRAGADVGTIDLTLSQDSQFDWWTKRGKTAPKTIIRVGIELVRESENIGSVRKRYTPYGERTIWSEARGWFSAAFGPFRRFTGGNQEYIKVFYNMPKAARHLSVFGEDVALTEAITWLQQLKFKELERGEKLLEWIYKFINQDDFLPFGVKLREVTSDKVVFTDPNGTPVSVDNLSDGFRSILSLTFELIRQIYVVYGSGSLFEIDEQVVVKHPGVVLVDEIDAHLHPTWQVRVGEWFKKYFPNMQFIVSTHSPLVCQSANTIWKLPDPSTNEQGVKVTGPAFTRLTLGNVLEAYSTDAFGFVRERSPRAQTLLQRLSNLNASALERDLSNEEEEERHKLRATFNTEGR